MKEEATIRTATMAGIYADQGHYEKAADIYRFLLKQDPTRKDIAAALGAIEKKQSREKSHRTECLVSLLEEWITLIFRYNRLQELEKIKKCLNEYGGENGR